MKKERIADYILKDVVLSRAAFDELVMAQKAGFDHDNIALVCITWNNINKCVSMRLFDTRIPGMFKGLQITDQGMQIFWQVAFHTQKSAYVAMYPIPNPFTS